MKKNMIHEISCFEYFTFLNSGTHPDKATETALKSIVFEFPSIDISLQAKWLQTVVLDAKNYARKRTGQKRLATKADELFWQFAKELKLFSKINENMLKKCLQYSN